MASFFSSSQPSTRPLVLQQATTRLSIPIPSSSEAWIAAEVIREEFYHSVQGDEDLVEVAVTEYDDEGNVLQAVTTTEPQVKLLSKFLAYVNAKVVASGSPSKTDASQILLSSFNAFNALFLSNEAVHSLVQGYDVDIRAKVLAAYYKAFTTLREVYGTNDVKLVQTSALFQAASEGKAELYALFGGQGVNEVSRTPISNLTPTFSRSIRMPILITLFLIRFTSMSSSLCTISTSLLLLPSSLPPVLTSTPWPPRLRTRVMLTTPTGSTSSTGSMEPLLDLPLNTLHRSLCRCPLLDLPSLFNT
jgi:hypothetical protein